MISVAVGGDHDGLVLTEFDGLAGVLDERGDVGAEEHLAVADADHQRGRAPGGDDGARLVGVGEHQREVALQPRQHRHHGADEVARGRAVVVLPGHQVDGDLGVGVAGELDAGGLQLGAQRGEVLDDPVVDDGDLARRRRGAGGRCGRSACRGWPSGCAPCRCCRPGRSASDSASAASRLASRPARRRTVRPPCTVEQRDTRGVVARGTPSDAARRRRCPRAGRCRRSRRFHT